jgi:hypothetical protein
VTTVTGFSVNRLTRARVEIYSRKNASRSSHPSRKTHTDQPSRPPALRRTEPSAAWGRIMSVLKADRKAAEGARDVDLVDIAAATVAARTTARPGPRLERTTDLRPMPTRVRGPGGYAEKTKAPQRERGGARENTYLWGKKPVSEVYPSCKLLDSFTVLGRQGCTMVHLAWRPPSWPIPAPKFGRHAVWQREAGGIVQLPQAPPRFRRGQHVRIIRGPFQSHDGLDAGQAPHDRERVLSRWVGMSGSRCLQLTWCHGCARSRAG